MVILIHLLLKIFVQEFAEYNHIDQSYKPAWGKGLLGAPKTKPKLPELLMFKINHFGPGALLKWQPAFAAANELLPFPNCGLDVGLLIFNPEFKPKPGFPWNTMLELLIIVWALTQLAIKVCALTFINPKIEVKKIKYLISFFLI